MEVMSTSTTVIPSYSNAIPPIDPNDPRIVHQRVHLDQKANNDLGYASPAKYPKYKESTQRKAKKHDDDKGKKNKNWISAR